MMRKGYPKDWKIRSRFIRYYRARNRCEWCGAENGKPHPETGSLVMLTVAHIYNKRPSAASLLNLAALCQRCHLGHDREDHLRSAARTRWKKKHPGQAVLTDPQGKPII